MDEVKDGRLGELLRDLAARLQDCCELLGRALARHREARDATGQVFDRIAEMARDRLAAEFSALLHELPSGIEKSPSGPPGADSVAHARGDCPSELESPIGLDKLIRQSLHVLWDEDGHLSPDTGARCPFCSWTVTQATTRAAYQRLLFHLRSEHAEALSLKAGTQPE